MLIDYNYLILNLLNIDENLDFKYLYKNNKEGGGDVKILFDEQEEKEHTLRSRTKRFYILEPHVHESRFSIMYR